MRILPLALSSATLLLAGCTSGGLFGGGESSGPDEFAVTRAAPLVVPPDFALVPPRPGQATATDSRGQAVEALFGPRQQRSAAEQQIMRESGSEAAAQGARSVAGDPDTNVVDKGATTQTILAVPEGDGQEASVQTPQ